MPPKVSVIVPNYNHAPYLKERIDSILNQTYQDFELILLDDCSMDNSRDILLSYKDNPHVTQIVFNETNSGSPFAQWNKGIELAKGEWIWIAESDDWADLDFLEVMMREVAQYPSVGLAYTWTYFMQDGKEVWHAKDDTNLVVRYRGIDYIQNKLLYGNSIVNVSMAIFRKYIFVQVNPLTYNWMHLAGDWMLYVRMAELTDVLEIQSRHSYYRQHPSNISKSAEHEGRTFLEGLDVIDHIKSLFSLPSFDFAHELGRMLFKYEKQYHFSTHTQKRIYKRMFPHYKLALCYYWIYKIRN